MKFRLLGLLSLLPWVVNASFVPFDPFENVQTAESSLAPAVRIDARGDEGGFVVNAMEQRVSDDGKTSTTWNINAGGWLENSEEGGLSVDLLSLNASTIAVEGGRLGGHCVDIESSLCCASLGCCAEWRFVDGWRGFDC